MFDWAKSADTADSSNVTVALESDDHLASSSGGTSGCPGSCS